MENGSLGLKLKRWLAPPAFSNEDTTRRASILNAVLVIAIASSLLVFAGNLLGGKTPPFLNALNVVATAACLVLRYWMYQGKVTLASIGLLLLGIVGITVSVAGLGSIRTPTAAMYILLVIAAGFLFDLSAMIVMTVLCSLAVVGLIVVENAGLLPRPDYSVTITQWVTYAALFIWASSLTFSSIQSIRQVLTHAESELAERKRADDQLKQLNLELEQRVAERTVQLEKSQAQQRTIADDLNAIFATVTDGISIADANGNLIAVNDALAELHGYSRKEDLVGTAGIELVAEQDRVRAFEYLRQALLAGPASNIEYRLVRQDGTEFHGEVSVAPIHDESNYPTRFVAVTRDITQRQAAKQALQASQDYARNIIDSSLDMIIAVDMERRITEFNKAAEEAFGYRREQVLGKSIDLLYADLVESGSVHARTVLKGRDVIQILNKSKNGRIFPSLLSASVLRDPHGTPIGYMGISRDVTEFIRAEEEQERLFDQVRTGRERLQLLSKQLLDAQESERRHIARELHDEIGQAMTGVQMNLQIIEPLLTDASAKTCLEDTSLAIERVLQQIRNLSLDLRPSILDDFGLVPALRWLLERQAQRTGLDIQFNVAQLEKRAPEQIETVCFRVTQEAITNIIRHAHARHASVQLSRSQSNLELTIQDDGGGFDVTQAVARAAQGSSMGLLGMQERVILVGGKVEISSTLNQGTRIHVIIPLNAPTGHMERRSKRRTGNETNAHSVSR